MPQSNKHFFLLDAFRGIASVWLVAFHMLPKHYPDVDWLVSFFLFGRIGTDFFFVAAGYVSFIACVKLLKTQHDGGFARKRLSRVYSLYWVSLILGLVVVPTAVGAIYALKTSAIVIDTQIPGFQDLLLHLSLLQVFTSDTWSLNKVFLQTNGVYWFIA